MLGLMPTSAAAASACIPRLAAAADSLTAVRWFCSDVVAVKLAMEKAGSSAL